MNLKQMLNLKDPSMQHLEETEALLTSEINKASRQLLDLDAEDVTQTTNRLLGKDDGLEARRIARDEASRARTDYSHALAGVQATLAIERARQAEEIESAAWDVTWQHLARRRAAMAEIETLLDRISDLFYDMRDAYDEATTSAPKKPGPENRASTTAGHSHEAIAKAVLVALNSRLNYVYPVAADNALETVLRIHGLPAYLTATENRLMLAPVLNPDGGPLPVRDELDEDDEAQSDGGPVPVREAAQDEDEAQSDGGKPEAA